jgi:cytochrome P450
MTTTATANRGPSIDVDSPGFQTMPWPIYERFRRDEPVHLSPNGSWYVFRHDAVRHALGSPELGAEHPFRTTRRAFGPSMVDRDGEPHQRLRSVASVAFRPKHIDSYQTELIEPLVHDLLDELAGRDVVDFGADFAAKVPIRVFCGVMGIPTADADRLYAALRPLVDHIDQAGVSLAEVTARRAVLRGYFQKLIADESYGPGLVRLFAEAGAPTTEADVLNNLMMLLAAGTETTGLAIGNVLACLLRHPPAYDSLREDPTLIPGVVRESLRLEPPLHFVARFPTADLTVDRVTIPAGASVQLCLGSANRDEDRYDRPDVWDPRRDAGNPLTFGTGRHGCLGFGLANRELEVVLRVLSDRDLVLRPVGDTVPLVRGRSFRGVRHFPVRLDRRRRAGVA